MGNRCEQCHTVKGWTPAAQISVARAFQPLPAAGRARDASLRKLPQGAANGVFVGMSTECINCHRREFLTAQNPPHQASFPADCSMCHNMNSWLGATFNHALVAHFPLTGAHATTPCTACHVGGNFASAPTACISCHQADLQTATNPNHIAAGFSTDCSQCHNTTTWLTATFDHNAVFPLTGAHAALACTQCHTGASFATAPLTCVGCHLTDYNQTTNPNHAQAAFPTDCSLCHSTIDWTGATFDHSKTTFPLTGAHVTTPCAPCHVNNNYTTLADRTANAMPSHRVQPDHQSESLAGRLPSELLALPQHDELDHIDVQPLEHGLPADRRSRHDALRILPRRQQLHHRAHRLLFVP